MRSAIPARAVDYIRDMSEAMRDRYAGDCVLHVCRTAELLLAEGLSPWVGVVRDIVEKDGTRYHGPLIPVRYAGKGALAWTTHYVTCVGKDAYDPLIGVPAAIDSYGVEVFGRPLEVRTHFDSAETARLLAGGEIRAAFRPEKMVLRPST